VWHGTLADRTCPCPPISDLADDDGLPGLSGTGIGAINSLSASIGVV
jgi:hypothetical protein